MIEVRDELFFDDDPFTKTSISRAANYTSRPAKGERMNSGIRAIETYYSGYRFRSRLEARWAVFFNSLSIQFEYEPQGFVVSGIPYLPDFFLREYDIFIEIKPTYQEFKKIIEKMIFFSYDYPIAVFYDLPESLLGYIFCNDLADSSGGSFQADCWWDYSKELNSPVINIEGFDDRTLYADSSFSRQLNNKIGFFKMSDYGGEIIRSACLAAKQARFEYEERDMRRF